MLRFIRNTRNLIKSDVHYCSTMNTQVIKEGQAEISLIGDNVFYNRVQEFNRDLSIAVLRTFTTQLNSDEKSKGNTDEQKLQNISILEALSASGLRSIRYAKEIPNVTKIIANDLSDKAVEAIEENIKMNKVESIVKANRGDAVMVMHQNKRHHDRFTAVDLDPYGCPSIFLDSAVQCVKDGGLLLVTATDMAVLAGNSPETCYSKYGAISLKTKACHEQAIRILLQCIESHANRYGRYIEPLLSVSVDFYIRVFVKIFTSPIQCKKTTSKLSMVYQCVGCDTIHFQPLGGFKPNPSAKDPNRAKAVLPHGPPVSTSCENCASRFNMGGPIWTAPIHENSFVSDLLTIVQSDREKFGTHKRIEGILGMVLEELPEIPLYYSMDKLCSCIHVEMIPMLKMRSAILNGGYKVSYSHACKTSIKTNAPSTFIWDILRFWEKTHPIKEKRLLDDLVAKHILNKSLTSEVNLADNKNANPMSRRDGFLRFQFNPDKFWGPGQRGSSMSGEDKMSKSRKNQNKNQNVKRKLSSDSANDNNSKVKKDEDVQ